MAIVLTKVFSQWIFTNNKLIITSTVLKLSDVIDMMTYYLM